MQFKHVQGDNLFVPGSISKNKRDELVPLSSDYAARLKGEPDHYIFGGKKMKGPNFYGRLFSTLKHQLKLGEDVDLYSCKHKRAYDLARAKVDPYAIMRLFRHSSLEITMKYLRSLSVEIDRTAVEGHSF